MTTALAIRPQVAKPQTQDLFALKYRCQITLDGNLLVTNPAGRSYMVNLRNQSCSCPASVTCKHSKGAKALALAQCEQLWREGADWQIAAVADGHNEGMWQRGQTLVHRASALHAWANEEVAR